MNDNIFHNLDYFLLFADSEESPTTFMKEFYDIMMRIVSRDNTMHGPSCHHVA